MVDKIVALWPYAWMYWTGALVLIAASLLLAFYYQKRSSDKPAYEQGGMLLSVCGSLLLFFGTLQSSDQYLVDQAIRQDPELREMAGMDEVLPWMRSEVEPLILSERLAHLRLANAKSEYEAAKTDLENVGVELEEKKREYEEKFYPLSARDHDYGRRMSPIMISLSGKE